MFDLLIPSLITDFVSSVGFVSFCNLVGRARPDLSPPIKVGVARPDGIDSFFLRPGDDDSVIELFERPNLVAVATDEDDNNLISSAADSAEISVGNFNEPTGDFKAPPPAPPPIVFGGCKAVGLGMLVGVACVLAGVA